MIDPSSFEQALERRLRTRARLADRPFDAGLVARAAIADSVAARRSLGWAFSARTSLAWIAVAALLALVAAAGVIATLPPRPESVLLAIGQRDGLRMVQIGASDGLHIGNGPYSQPRWAPNGEFVAVTALTDVDMNHLFVYRADGTVVTDLTGVTGEIEWAPSGLELAFQSIATHQIGVLVVGEGAVRMLPSPPDLASNASFSWSPDGERIVVAAHVREDGRLGPAWILETAGLAPAARFGTGDASGLGGPRWSPEGSRIAAVERCPNGDCIRLRDAASGQRRAEVMSLDAPSRAAWSPDGAWLAFDSGGDLYIASADVMRVRPLTAGPSVDRFLEWAPDGRSVVVWRIVTEGGQEPYEFWSVPIDGSKPTLLVQDAFGVSIRPGTAR